jgi:4-hydroxy-tetrahydrodipicolinate synthase
MSPAPQDSHAKPLPPGLWPVALTPFRDDRSIDWDALDALLDFYIAAGAAGLFVCAGSAEIYTLSEDEQIAIDQRALAHTRDRVPVIAGGITAGTIEHQAAFVRRVAATGVRAVVLSTSMPAPRDHDERQWREPFEQLVWLAGGIPLGLYETPQPYHRVLSPETMQWVASTGRFVFHKDTTSNLDHIRRKIAAVAGSTVGFYNADTPTLLASLDAGGDGFSGIGANLMPELYAWLCAHFDDAPEQAAKVQQFLTDANNIVHHKYPLCAKAFLGLRGAETSRVCRVTDAQLDDREMQTLQTLLTAFQRLCFGVGIHPVQP